MSKRLREILALLDDLSNAYGATVEVLAPSSASKASHRKFRVHVGTACKTTTFSVHSGHDGPIRREFAAIVRELRT